MGSEVQNRIKEVVMKQLRETANFGIQRQEDIGWRQITGRDVKTLDPLEQTKMQKIAYYLYDKNGIGHRMLERYKDFVVGDGLTYSCTDSDVKQILDEHWEMNQWEMKQYQKVMELGLYGEQFYPVFVNDQSGAVKLGYIDPELVSEVKTNPDNAEEKISFTYNSSVNEKTKTFKIINEDANPNNTSYSYLMGDAFYFFINTVSNGPRGRSDLFPLADAIDAYENFLFNRAERADIMNRITYDLELQGKTSEEIQEILRTFDIPKADEVFGHNEKTKLTQVIPELGSQDASNEAKLLLNHILAGGGWPPHWFAVGEGLTRATAVAMDLPTKKQLKTRQRIFKWMVSYIFRFVIHQAILHKRLNENKKNTFVNINLPKIEEKEAETVSRTLVAVTNALTVAEENGWISSNLAKRVFVFVLSALGQDIQMEETEEEEKTKDKKLKELYMRRSLPRLEKTEEEEE